MQARATGFLAVAAALALAACASTPTAEVTRFHMGQPIPSDTIRVVPSPDPVAPGTAQSLEFRTHANIIAQDLARHGFRLVETGPTAYLAILKKEKRPDGSPVPIRAIARKIASNDSKFRRDEFLIDLSRLAVEGPAEVSGFKFELQQTSDTSQGMLLYGPASSGMINLLIFTKVTP
jgi:hypothetical protein